MDREMLTNEALPKTATKDGVSAEERGRGGKVEVEEEEEQE